MPKYSVKKPYTVFVAVVLLLVLGGVSFTKITTDLLPSISLPYVVVVTTYPGASPEKVESSVTSVLESGLGTVNGVENVTSTSNENYSMIMLEFEEDTNMDSAMVKLSTAIDQITLPDMATTPTLMEMSPDMMATMQVSIDYEGKDIYELTDFTNDTIIPYLERQSGVASVESVGAVEESVQIELNQDKIDEINDKLLAKANDKLADAKNELTDAKSQLSDAKTKIESGQSELESQQESTTSQLAAASQGIDQAVATKAAYSAQVSSLEASKAALEAEKKAYEDNNIVESLDGINTAFTTIRDQISSEETYNTILAAIVQGATGNTEVTAENVTTILPMLDEATLTALKTAADKQVAAQLDAIPADVKDALDNPEKLNAVKELMSQQGQSDAADNMTKKNLQKLYDIVNTRIPQIDTELANLDTELIAAKAVLEKVTDSVSEATDNYTTVEEGKISAAAGFGSASAELSAGLTAIENSESQLKEAEDSYETARQTAIDNANIDSLLDMDTLSKLISAQNFSMPAGYINDGEQQYILKVGDEFETVDQLKKAVLCNIDGIGDVKIKDVADVKMIDNADDSYAKVNGNDAILLAISKSSTAGTSDVSKTCNEAIETLQNENDGLRIVSLLDQGDYIKLIINSVLSNLIYGAILAIIVLAVFLKDVRPTVVVAFSIPMSVLFAIVLMYFSNITLNIISLSGLALGVGMLVDNSIVVIENIYRLRSSGVSAARAAVMGANQVAGAIAASTLTTICVFLPIVFTGGLTRELFTDMGLTIAYSLIASLIIALTVVPAMSATVLKNSKEKKHVIFDRVMDAYEVVLRFCLKVKIVPLALAVILLAFCGWRATKMGMELIPSMGGNQMSVSVTTPVEKTSEENYEIADKILSDIDSIDGVDTVGALSGSSTAMMGSDASASRQFSFYILLDEETAKDNTVVADKIEEQLKDMELEDYNVSTSNMDISSLMGSGMEIVVSGDDLDEILKVSEDMKELLGEIEGFDKISNGQEDSDTQIKITVNKNKAMKFGLTVAQVYSDLSKKLTTENTATTLTVDNEQYDVVISNKNDEITLKNLMDYEFETTTTDDEGKSKTKTHKLSEFATSQESESLASINRENQTRNISVTAETLDGYNTTLLSRDVQKLLDKYDTPQGCTVEIAGESTSVEDSMQDMILMISLAVVFIYLIMVAQFQSILSPFIVIFTIPLAFTGGLLALIITGETLSLVAMMGFLVLAGVVVNNGIVFVDYANQLRLDGEEKREALVKTGRTRMRPILMTALTTILAMSTMALGTDATAAMGKGMAIVTIGGLAYATLMTLFIVPVLYDLLFRREIKKVDLGDEQSLDDDI